MCFVFPIHVKAIDLVVHSFVYSLVGEWKIHPYPSETVLLETANDTTYFTTIGVMKSWGLSLFGLRILFISPISELMCRRLSITFFSCIIIPFELIVTFPLRYWLLFCLIKHWLINLQMFNKPFILILSQLNGGYKEVFILTGCTQTLYVHIKN